MSTSPISLFNQPQFNQALFNGLGTGFGCQTAYSLIYAALRKAAVTIGPGRTPSPAQMADALDELRRLTGSLNCDRMFIYSMVNYIFPLTGSKTYTIGQDTCEGAIADFDVPRPQLIEQANVIMTAGGSTRRPLFIATEQQWAKIVVQDIPNAVPEMLYNDRAYPISTLYLWGQPMAGYQLELFVWNQVPTFVAVTDHVALPLQYEDALVLNLAVRLAPHFQRVVDPDIRQQARESLMRLESINAPQPIADTGALGHRRDYWNIYSDVYR